MHIRNEYKFQVDTGATCNVMRLSDLPPGKMLEPVDTVLTMYNGTKMKAHGKCVLNVRNPKTKQKHRADFVVVNEAANSILGAQLVQKMGLAEVRYDRIHVIDDPKPGMTVALRDYVERCETCKLFDHKQHKETLMSHEVPSRPWSKVGSDLFEMKDHHYLVLVDYYSSFIEVERLTTTNTTAVIRAMKKQFARYGVPGTLITDRGPQYTSNEFQDFAKAWKFQHNMSSPGHHQSNGKAENAVK